MNAYLELGTVNRLKIARETDYGLVLASTEAKEVLLPKRYILPSMKIGDTIDVFVYTDSEDRIVATTQQPEAMLGEVALMEVVDVTSHGAYLHWGLPKDLFVPKMFQRMPMRKGDRRIVRVAYDEKTHRLVGTEIFDRQLKRAGRNDLKRNQAVEILVYAKTDLGYKAVVEKRYDGLVFHSDIFEPMKIKETKTAYIKQIRDDGKIDLLLRPIGKKSDDIAADKIVAFLDNQRGMMPLNYKSDPERIKALLGLSRKNFKRALTKLLEQGKIEVKENGTYLKAKQRKREVKP
ncbi:CvfB family protein [Hydrogenimonas urashimensis]|uniref:CvfB family protein n=1 Tax=Hydrogenimonas urashimensis TaxID=2740515 RepID=UPI001916AD3A|nr:S1-like domain-containing RNA-binding protein [Hydrogenimonas urashimensis]